MSSELTGGCSTAISTTRPSACCSIGSACKPVNLEGLIAPGDSGGGVFIDTPNGPELAGVNSFAMSWDGRVNSSYGDASGHTRVSAFENSINSYLTGQATTPALGTAANAWYRATAVMAPLGPVPEPSTFALLAAGAVLLLAVQRRRFMAAVLRGGSR